MCFHNVTTCTCIDKRNLLTFFLIYSQIINFESLCYLKIYITPLFNFSINHLYISNYNVLFVSFQEYLDLETLETVLVSSSDSQYSSMSHSTANSECDISSTIV